MNPKDNFWPATARTKPQIEAWFKDLAGKLQAFMISIPIHSAEIYHMAPQLPL